MQIQDRTRETRTFAVLAVVCAVLQLAIAPNVALGNGRANFALVFVACMTLYQGPQNPVTLGFFAGLFFDLTTTGPIGLMAFCLSIAGFVLSTGGRDALANDATASSFLFAAVTLVVSLVYHLAMLFVGQADSILDVLVFRTLPTAFLTFVFFLPFAYYFGRVRSNGPNLGGGKKGGHFSTKGL